MGGLLFVLCMTILVLAGCRPDNGEEEKPRLSMFVGVDISGSFKNSKYYDDAMDFLANYIYAHVNGLGELEVPSVFFVGSIGGAKAEEPKTFYPRQTFEHKSVEEIRQTLHDIFPPTVVNPFTDYNAFFEQVASTVQNKKLILRPISIVMITDGIPDLRSEGQTEFRSIQLKPLEGLARNITVRLLYTRADIAKSWQTQVPRSRVKVWTQDAEVMVSWKDPKILLPEKPFEEQNLLLSWIKDNVDYGVSSRRVD